MRQFADTPTILLRSLSISVNGGNDMPLADRLLSALKTVRAKRCSAAAEAIELLVQVLADKPKPKHTVLPVQLIVRDSTAARPQAQRDTAHQSQSTTGAQT